MLPIGERIVDIAVEGEGIAKRNPYAGEELPVDTGPVAAAVVARDVVNQNARGRRSRRNG